MNIKDCWLIFLHIHVHYWPIHTWSEGCQEKQHKSSYEHVILPQPEYIALFYALPGLSTSGNWHDKFFDTCRLQSSCILSHKYHCCSAEKPGPEIVTGNGNWSLSLMLTPFINTLNLVSSPMFTAGNKSRIFLT